MNDPIRHIVNACDPMAPASKVFYTDTTAARGNSSFVRHYLRRLATAQSATCDLFSGHIGCGKSSELKELYQNLESETDPSCPRFFPIYLDADEYLNFYDVTPNDVLLAIAAEVGAALRERKNIELADNYLTKRLRGVLDGLTTDISLEKADVGLGDLKATLKPLPKDENARAAVQEALRPQTSRISDELNLALTKAVAELQIQASHNKERRYDGIVVIVDSLDRVRRVSGCENTEMSWRELFVRNAELLRGVEAHLVYTVPLALVRSVQDNLQGAYGQPAFVLPMVTSERRHHLGTPYEAWQNCLRELLTKRVAPLPLTGEGGVFDEAALTFLLRYCGGHPRHLLSFVVEAALNIDKLPITWEAAQRSVVPTVRQFSPSIPSAYYALMAQVARDPQQQIDNSQQEYRNMLEQNWVLEYVNGGDYDKTGFDAFAASAQWYAVHPIIRELASFKSALQQNSPLTTAAAAQAL